jgi:hypothetical protein
MVESSLPGVGTGEDRLARLDEDAGFRLIVLRREAGEGEGAGRHADRDERDPLPVAGQARHQGANVDVEVRSGGVGDGHLLSLHSLVTSHGKHLW